MLLAFVEVIEQAGSRLAHPTTALHVESLPPGPSGSPEPRR